MIAGSREYAPNIPDAIVGMQVLAPPDIEARFGLTGGHIFQGELVPEQAFDMRPVPGLDRTRGRSAASSSAAPAPGRAAA